MNVPFYSFEKIPERLKSDWNTAISRVINEGIYIGGPEVKAFESEFAEYLGVEHLVGVASGLDAITLGLRALGIGPGSRVAVPAHTFIATWLSVLEVGATPIGFDVDIEGLIDLDQLEQYSRSLDVVIPVHMHGAAVDMLRLTSWARDRGVLVLEDCAQAHGAFTSGKKVGSWGDVGAFSFYPTKNLGAIGDAGALTAKNPIVNEKVRSLGNYGAFKNDKYVHMIRGVNSRLDPIQAAVLSCNLEHLDSWNAQRKVIAQSYINALENIPFELSIPHANNQECVWHHFIVRSPHRDALRTHLSQQGVATEIHYPLVAAYEIDQIEGRVERVNQFPVAEQVARESLSLPLSPWMTEAQVDEVLSAFASFTPHS